MDDLPDRAWRFIRTRNLLSPGHRVVVALSGGPDSVALALVLMSLCDDGRLPLHLSLAHLNHCLRGAESDRDEAFCRSFAEQRGLHIAVERADVGAHARAHRRSVEAAAREVRYDFLGRVADRLGAAAVATAHHADDVAETVLLRLLRGAGVHALGAIAPARPLSSARPHVRLVRPLLEVRKADLLDYLAHEAQAFCTDSSNRDTGFARNKVRHALIPMLEREFPSFSARSLCGLNASALESAALLESLLDRLWPRLCSHASPEAVTLDRAALADAPIPVRKAAARRAFRTLCDPPAPALSAEHLAQTAHLPEQPVGACVALPRGILARREHGLVRFVAAPAAGLPPRTLRAPGEVELPEVGLRIEARLPPPGSMGPAEAAENASESEVYLALEPTGATLTVRSRRPGDRFHPLGTPGGARLKKFLIDRKVPRGERDRIPLVIARDGAVAWVVGHRIGEPFKLRDRESPVLRLCAVRMGEASV